MTQESIPPDGPKHEAALSRELSEFLLEFSIGVHRHAIYPRGHPSLLPVAENIIGRLEQMFVERRTLSIGVARDQLVIEGMATDSRHPVLSDLARRLHGHQLGALSLAQGVGVMEVEALLTTLARDPELGGEEPLGLLPRDEIPSWDHVRLYPLGYEQLELKEREGQEEEPQLERSTQLWLGLARAAMTTDAPLDAESAQDPQVVARSIQSHRREAAYDQVIVGYLLQLADELKDGAGRESESVRRRVSTLIRELDDPTLERLVSMGGSSSQRRKFVLDANQSLAVDSVVRIAKAAANASEQTISSSLTRLLAKLSTHAEAGSQGVRDHADAALRENVEDLLENWELKDPNPGSYTLMLDSLAKAAPVFHGSEGESEGDTPGAQRLVQMSLEVDSWGATVVKAVTDLVEAGELVYLLEMVDCAPQTTEVAARVREFLTSPAQLRRLLTGTDVHEPTLRFLVGRMGEAATPVLLDVLTDSDSRSIRRKVFDVLATLAKGVGDGITKRLEDPRWYVVRNMLALIQRLPERPHGFVAAPFMEHPDARVRREAFPLALRESPSRERILAMGLADPDERLLRMALLEIQGGVPETLLPVLVNRVVMSARPADLRTMGVRVLGFSRSPLALDALLQVSTAGRTILGRPRLAPPSPEVLAAVQVLAQSWPDDPRAKSVLAAARRSKEPGLAGAAAPRPEAS